MHAALAAAERDRTFLNGGLQLHAAFGHGGHGLRRFGGHAPDLQLFKARQLGFDALPPHLGGVVEAVHDYRVGLAAGLGQRFVFGLAHFDPHPLAAREIGQRRIRVIRVRQARAKAQCGVAIAQVIELVRLNRQRCQPHHHALVGLARVAGQRERVVGVIAVVDVCDLQIRFENGGFDGHF